MNITIFSELKKEKKNEGILDKQKRNGNWSGGFEKITIHW